jgi:hypothetical protein
MAHYGVFLINRHNPLISKESQEMKYTPGSFTKNFGNGLDFQRLTQSIARGFGGSLKVTSRSHWRENAALPDRSRELIPLNFFLFNEQDDVLVDELVERCIRGPYNIALERLALFTLHLANSGTWKKSEWPDGRVAGWCNEYIREIAWTEKGWRAEAFSAKNLDAFIRKQVDAYPKSRTKIRNNYRYLLRIAGLLGKNTGYIDLCPNDWGRSACKIFWDRTTYQGLLPRSPHKQQLLLSFCEHEIFKLLGCGKETGLRIADKAADEYLDAGSVARFQ